MTPEIRKFIDDSRAVCEGLDSYERDSDRDFTCAKCGEVYDCNTECEPSYLCHGCAQEFSEHARTALPAALEIIEKQAKRIEELEAETSKPVSCLSPLIQHPVTTDIDPRLGPNQWSTTQK